MYDGLSAFVERLEREGELVRIGREVVGHLVSVLEERGTQAWWADAPDEPCWIPSGLPQGTYRRGTDTMDVWFDSGSSWSMMDGRADVYLEGSDQHRGWFQSSLLTRIAAGASPAVDETRFAKGTPFKQLITHGFTLDQEGKKMSKSLGNTISPEEVMDGKRSQGTVVVEVGQFAVEALQGSKRSGSRNVEA